MPKKNPCNHRSPYRVSSLLTVTVLLCLWASVLPARAEALPPPQVAFREAELGQTADAGTEYIDQMVFFGESTTSHLRSRGVLRDGAKTWQVWADESGTKTLSSRLLSETLIYPKTGEHLTIAQAVAAERPTYLVLSFGLNNLSGFIGSKALYVNNYKKLIQAIQQASPDTKILLQSVYPVSSACTSFSVDGKTVCAYTRTLNGWLRELAAEYDNVRYVDSASVLYNEDGMLAAEYDAGDGVHLTTVAYTRILAYLRTHAWPEAPSS